MTISNRDCGGYGGDPVSGGIATKRTIRDEPMTRGAGTMAKAVLSASTPHAFLFPD